MGPSKKDLKIARIALSLLVGITVVASATPAAKILVIIVPVFSFVLALFLQERLPEYYVSFVCWLFFLIPLVRRLIEFKSGASSGSLVMISPFLGCLAGMAVYRHQWSRIFDERVRSWIFVLVAIAYAMFVGFLLHPVSVMLQEAAAWTAPVCFAFYLYAKRDLVQETLRGLRASFIYGSGLLSLYGLYQYFFLAPWDAAWMNNNPTLSSIGVPEPRGVRLFSTLNTPQPLAACLVFGIVICIASKARLRNYIVPLTVLVLALTESRSGYVGAAVGILYLAAFLTTRQRVQILLIGLGTMVVIGLAAQVPEIGETLTQRVGTFKNVDEDGSYADRKASQATAINLFEGSPFGLGMGEGGDPEQSSSPSYGVALPEAPVIADNGLEQVLLTYGWLGSIVFLFGFGGAVLLCFRSLNVPELAPFKAGLIALVCIAPIMGVFAGVDVFFIWTSLGICAAYRFGPRATAAAHLLPATS